MKKLLVFSDSHGDIKQMLDIQQKNNILADCTIHAGDFCCDEETIQNIAQFYVAGNCDDLDKEKIIFCIDKINFYLCHGYQYYNCLTGWNWKQIAYDLKKHHCQVMICGHSHIPLIKKNDQFIFLNPGSIKRCRDDHHQTYGLITIDNGQIGVEIKENE